MNSNLLQHPTPALAQELPQVLFRSEKFCVVAKPAHWLTIPDRHPERPVLVEWVKKQEGIQTVLVTHRLDYETSGLVLFALGEAAHQEACGWFTDRRMKKSYLCLAEGSAPSPIFKVNTPIEGKPSSTQFEVLWAGQSHADPENPGDLGGPVFLVRATPRTGRRHQIRIHAKATGTPLLGDTLYTGKKHLGPLEFHRTALHAESLTLPTGEKFRAPLPADFANWLQQLQIPNPMHFQEKD